VDPVTASSARPGAAKFRDQRNNMLDRSGDNIGKKLILKLRNLILETEFSFFQPRQLQLVRFASKFKRFYGAIQVPMFLFQPVKPSPQYAFLLNIHLHGASLLVEHAACAQYYGENHFAQYANAFANFSKQHRSPPNFAHVFGQ